MKTVLSRALKTKFHQRMKEEFPLFQKIGTESGGIIYCRDMRPDFYAFVFLNVSGKFDRFTIELATNSISKYPLGLFPGDRTPQGASRTRISSLLPSGNDGWWNLTSSHLPDLKLVLESQKDLKGGLLRVDSTVEEALEQLRTVLPKFLQSSS